MANPVQLINILSNRTAAENIVCDDCKGAGEIPVFDPEMGHDIAECNACLGSGYNQLGLILHNILQPPEDGYGPVELREALANYRSQSEKEKVLRETQEAVRDAEQAIAETQQVIDKVKALISVESREIQFTPDPESDRASQTQKPEPRRRIS